MAKLYDPREEEGVITPGKLLALASGVYQSLDGAWREEHGKFRYYDDYHVGVARLLTDVAGCDPYCLMEITKNVLFVGLDISAEWAAWAAVYLKRKAGDNPTWELTGKTNTCSLLTKAQLARKDLQALYSACENFSIDFLKKSGVLKTKPYTTILASEGTVHAPSKARELVAAANHIATARVYAMMREGFAIGNVASDRGFKGHLFHRRYSNFDAAAYYAPTKVKAVFANDGRATKQRMLSFAEMYYKVAKKRASISEHEADALGVAITALADYLALIRRGIEYTKDGDETVGKPFYEVLSRLSSDKIKQAVNAGPVGRVIDTHEAAKQLEAAQPKQGKPK